LAARGRRRGRTVTFLTHSHPSAIGCKRRKKRKRKRKSSNIPDTFSFIGYWLQEVAQEEEEEEQ
jgi:hypothetical protein